MSSIYITGDLADRLIRAGEIIYQHLTGCMLCSAARPCSERDRAEGLFARYGILPRRTPGLTRLPPPRDWD